MCIICDEREVNLWFLLIFSDFLLWPSFCGLGWAFGPLGLVGWHHTSMEYKGRVWAFPQQEGMTHHYQIGGVLLVF
jgi:hypothetical protein